MNDILSRIGVYVLPGGVTDPVAGIAQAREAEKLGLGTLWIGERFDSKDLPSLAGAFSQVTDKITIAAGITPMNMRHPMVLASMGQTLQALSGGRFVLGFGRSAAWRWNNYGIDMPTIDSMGDVATILHRLWAGETVAYDGPAGSFPALRLAQRVDVAPPPMLLAGVGPKTLALAGAMFDGAILHPFLTPEAVGRSVELVREGARKAGKADKDVRVIATVVTAPDRTPHDTDLAIRARGAGYIETKGLGDAIVKANGWDLSELMRYRADPRLVALKGKSADKFLSRQELIELSQVLPDHWITSASASGTARQCSEKIKSYLQFADDIIIHGSTVEHLGGLIKELTL